MNLPNFPREYILHRRYTASVNLAPFHASPGGVHEDVVQTHIVVKDIPLNQLDAVYCECIINTQVFLEVVLTHTFKHIVHSLQQFIDRLGISKTSNVREWNTYSRPLHCTFLRNVPDAACVTFEACSMRPSLPERGTLDHNRLIVCIWGIEYVRWSSSKHASKTIRKWLRTWHRAARPRRLDGQHRIVGFQGGLEEGEHGHRATRVLCAFTGIRRTLIQSLESRGGGWVQLASARFEHRADGVGQPGANEVSLHIPEPRRSLESRLARKVHRRPLAQSYKS